jgi:broad specificity phosphatase PhoE
MKLYLIRHGQQENDLAYNPRKRRPDPELSSLGREQADLLGRRLSNHHISAIYTSDLTRAVQTAEIVNHYLCLTLEQESGLREIDMGLVSIQGWGQIAIEHPDFCQEFNRHSFDIAYPEGESGMDVQQRALPVLKDIVKHHSQESNLAIVCHGGVIMVLLTAILGISQEQRFRFQIDHCSISIVEYDSECQSFRILSVNDTLHLEENLKECR